jgi:hypothetical protein
MQVFKNVYIIVYTFKIYKYLHLLVLKMKIGIFYYNSNLEIFFWQIDLKQFLTHTSTYIKGNVPGSKKNSNNNIFCEKFLKWNLFN